MHPRDAFNPTKIGDAVNDDDLLPRIAIDELSSKDLSKALQHSLCGFALVHRNGRIRWANDVWHSQTDLTESTRLGPFLSSELYYTNRQTLMKKGFLDETLLRSREPVTRIVRASNQGSSQAFMMRLFGPMGESQDLCLLQILDITRMLSLKRNQATLQTIINGSSEPLMVLNGRGGIVAANQHAAQLLEIDGSELLGQSMERYFSTQHARSGMQWIQSELKRDGWWEGTLCFVNSKGEEVAERVGAYRAGDSTSGVRYILIVRGRSGDNDMSSLNETNRTLKKFGFPDRKHFELQIELATDSGRRFGLIHFSINLGEREMLRSAGGKPPLLKQILHRLKEKLPTDALLAPLCGNELAAVLYTADAAELERLAKKLRDTLRAGPYRFAAESLFLNAQVGIVISGNVFQNAEEYLLAAKTAAESARAANLHEIKVVDPLAARRAKGMEGLGGKLKRALRNGEFFPVYEPFVDLKDMRIVGCEALVRWNCPQEGILTPGQFLPAIESHGLMEELTEVVFFRACRDFNAWLGEGCQLTTLSLNVTARDVDPDFLPSLINRALHHSNLDDRFLQIEITEEGLIDHNRSISVIKALRERGVRVAIDDFGTGYSNLAYLKSLPVDALKIDRTFVMESTRDAGSRALVDSINFLGQKLGLKTIAEGIESSEQRDLMSVLGCDMGQGYLFATPRPARRFRQLLSRG